MRKQTGKSTSSTAATVPAPAAESVKIEVGAGADELVEPTTEKERYECMPSTVIEIRLVL